MSKLKQNLPCVVAGVPTWNAEEFITETLDSLAAQTYPNFKVVISDDASTDATAELCERYAAQDSRFSVVRRPRRSGWVGNVNALLRAIEPGADYLLVAFHDDVLRPEYVARLVERLEQNPDAVLAHSDVETVFQDGGREMRVYDKLEGLSSPVERAKLVLRRTGHWSVPIHGVFRARAASRIGGFKRHLAGEFSADWPWLLHMSMLGEFVRVPAVLCKKYYKESSLSRGWNFNTLHWLAVALSCAREVRSSDLGFADKLTLYALLGRRCLGWLVNLKISRVSVRK